VRTNGSVASGQVDIDAFKLNFQFADARTIVAWVRCAKHTAGLGILGVNSGNIHYDFSGLFQAGQGGGQYYSRWLNAAAGATLTTSAIGSVPNDQWFMATERFSVAGNDVVCEHLVDGRVMNHYEVATGYSAAYGNSWRLSNTTIGRILGMMSGALVVHRLVPDEELERIRVGTLRPQDVADAVAFWPFMDGAGAQVTEVINGYHGTLAAGASWDNEVPS